MIDTETRSTNDDTTMQALPLIGSLLVVKKQLESQGDQTMHIAWSFKLSCRDFNIYYISSKKTCRYGATRQYSFTKPAWLSNVESPQRSTQKVSNLLETAFLEPRETGFTRRTATC